MIVKLNRKYLKEIIQLRYEEQYEYQAKERDEKFEEENKKYFEKYIDQSLYFFGIVEDDQIVSITSFKTIEYAPVIGSDGKEIYIFNVYTRPQYRNRGLAKKSMMEGIEYFKNQGYDWFRLHTNQPIARHMYHQLGFHDSTTSMSLFIESEDSKCIK